MAILSFSDKVEKCSLCLSVLLVCLPLLNLCKYTWINMSLVHCIVIYHRTFPIENGICSIYSSLTYKRFFLKYILWEKNHLQCNLIKLYYVKHIKSYLHYSHGVQHSFVECGAHGIYHASIETYKRIVLHYGIWDRRNELILNMFAVANIMKLMWLAKVHYKMFAV